MKQFTPITFKVPKLKGISEKTIEEHLKLYQGYVKNANAVFEKMDVYAKDLESNTYALNELLRRFSFEYNGIRNHEVYFGSLESGPKPLSEKSPLKKLISETWRDFDVWLAGFKNFAATVRGIGWATLWYDPRADTLHTTWIDEQHLGLLNGCTMILGLDMWEHSYVADYFSSGKKQYIEDFFANLNWEVIEENLKKAKK
jgi:Fe-Mn family superoxide dismutase